VTADAVTTGPTLCSCACCIAKDLSGPNGRARCDA
jgi:hypothetical protein